MNSINYYFSDELVYALGWTVVHSLWQGMLIALVMALALIAMPKQRANLRYAIANTALFFILICAVGTFFYLYQKSGGFNDRSISIVEIENTVFTFDHDYHIMYMSEGNSWTAFFGDYFNRHLPMIVSIWLLGMMFFALRLLGSVAYVQHLKWNTSNQKLNVFWQKKVDQLKAELHLAKAVEIVESQLVKVPMVIGYIKPMILMPIGAINALSTEEVEAILAHELAHIARNDYLLNIFQSIVEVLFYFNPAVWWISANIRSERENCCDDIAIRVCGNPLTYAKALVKIQEMYQPAPSLAMSFAGRKNQLLNRVKRVLNQPQNKSNILEKALTTTLLFFVVIVFSLRATDLNSTAINHDAFGDLATIELDTVPPHRSNGNYTFRDDKEEISIEIEDNEIIYLKINGEEIPEDDIPMYQGRIADAMNNVPAPPIPPSIDEIPIAPPAPPTPPSIGDIPVAPPAPPAPPSINDIPVAPPAPPVPGKVKLKKVTKANGKTIIIIEDDHSNLHIHRTTPFPDAVENYWAAVAEDELQVMGNEIANQGNLALPIIENRPEQLKSKSIIIPTPNYKLTLDTIPPGMAKELEKEIAQMKEELNQSLEEYREKAEELAAKEIEFKKELLEKYKDENHEQLKEKLDDFRQIQEEMKTQLKENTRMEIEQMQELKERMLEEKQYMLEDLKAQQEQQRIHHQEMLQHHREVRQHHIEALRNQRVAERRNKAMDKMTEALIEDGIIKNENKYNLNFTNTELKVNGKKLTPAQLKKYKDIYEANSDESLGRFKMSVKKSGTSSSTTISNDN